MPKKMMYIMLTLCWSVVIRKKTKTKMVDEGFTVYKQLTCQRVSCLNPDNQF